MLRIRLRRYCGISSKNYSAIAPNPLRPSRFTAGCALGLPIMPRPPDISPTTIATGCAPFWTPPRRAASTPNAPARNVMKPMNRIIVIAKGQRPQPWLAYRRGRGPALCLERSRRAPALWRRREVQLDGLAAGTRARLGGEFSGAGLKDQRRDLLGAVDADPGAEQPAARAVATRLVRCQSETLAHHALHAGQRRGGGAITMRPARDAPRLQNQRCGR